MFEKFTTKDAADFKQRYQGTFGYFRKGEKKTLVRLEDIVTAGSKQVQFVTKDGIKCYLKPDSDDDTVGFEFIPPKRGYHNTTEGAFLLTRIPARQYLRGICSRNTKILSVYGTQKAIGFDSLHLLFECPITPKEMWDKILTQKQGSVERSVALSGQFAVSLDHKEIYCLGEPIGKIAEEAGSLTVTLTDPSLWLVEVKDALRRAYINGVVV